MDRYRPLHNHAKVDTNMETTVKASLRYQGNSGKGSGDVETAQNKRNSHIAKSHYRRQRRNKASQVWSNETIRAWIENSKHANKPSYSRSFYGMEEYRQVVWVERANMKESKYPSSVSISFSKRTAKLQCRRKPLDEAARESQNRHRFCRKQVNSLKVDD